MGLDIIRSIQSISSPLFDVLFELFTILGEETLVIPLLALLYWAVDKRFGEFVGFSIFTSYLFNNALKDIFKSPRPIGEEGIRVLRESTATGYSFPSGHAQGAAAFWGSLAAYLKRRSGYLLSMVIILLVALSRLYLGVHYLEDVIAGVLLGLLVVLLCRFLFERYDPMGLYGFLFLLGILGLLVSRSTDYIKALGSYTGFFLGIWLEKKHVNFSTAGTLATKGFRVLFGVLLVFGIRTGLKLVFPEELLFDYLRYFALTFFAIGLYPWIFKRWRF